jgi:hypothetical protein
VFDLEHDALVRLVAAVERLRDDAIEPGALELGEPPLGEVEVVAGVRCTDGPAPARAATNAERRSANGRPDRSASPKASRSNAMNEAGVFSASMLTRDAAGWMRC